MRTRQFRQLAGLGARRRPPLLEAGLRAVGANVQRLSTELDICVKSGALQTAPLLWNVGREEAGKFLVLIDACRCPDADQETLSSHFRRAGDHLAKLIYAQIADYSIGSQAELVGAVNHHRPALHLDGPNDFDWIFPNQLIADRESELYVDLVETEDGLEWSVPHENQMPIGVSRSARLVMAIMETGLVSEVGLRALGDAWAGFDAAVDSHCSEWAERTAAAISALGTDALSSAAAAFVSDRWPMPMVGIDISKIEVEISDLQDRRAALEEAWFAEQHGLPLD